MITRTVVGTKATVIAVNTMTLSAEKKVLTIAGTFDSNEKLLKALKKLYDNDNEIISTVLSTDKFEELYGLDEAIFMKYAIKLDAKTRKPINTAEPQAEPQAEPTVEPQTEPQNGMSITAPITVTEVKAKVTKKIK